MSSIGLPASPKPPNMMVAPSKMSETASAALATRLSIILRGLKSSRRLKSGRGLTSGANRRLSGSRHPRVVVQAGLVEQNAIFVVVEPERLWIAADDAD